MDLGPALALLFRTFPGSSLLRRCRSCLHTHDEHGDVRCTHVDVTGGIEVRCQCREVYP